MKKEETKESEKTAFEIEGSEIDTMGFPILNMVSLMNGLRESGAKLEPWMAKAIEICNGYALYHGFSLDLLRKANQQIVGKMNDSEKELTGSDYMKTLGNFLSRQGLKLPLGDIEYTARRNTL